MGDIDDSSDKLRRNAIVLSFALIVTSFLGVKINSQDITILGSKIHSDVPAWKCWIILFLTQFYCFARYWTDKVNQAYVREFLDKYKYTYVNNLESLLRVQFYIDLDRAESSMFDLEEIESIRKLAKSHGVELVEERVRFHKYEYSKKRAEFSRGGRLSSFSINTGNTTTRSFTMTSSVNFKLSATLFLMLHLKALGNSVRPDSVVLEVSPPLFLGLIGYAIALLNLVRSIVSTV